MRTLMVGQVNQLSGFPHAPDNGFLKGFAFADQGNYATIVVRIHLPVEQINARNLHGINNGINFALVTAFRKVGNTFNQSGHRPEEYPPAGCASKLRCGRRPELSE